MNTGNFKNQTIDPIKQTIKQTKVSFNFYFDLVIFLFFVICRIKKIQA